MDLQPPTIQLDRGIVKALLPKYKRHDDLVIIQESAWQEFKRNVPLPIVKFDNNPACMEEDELASIVCQTIQKPDCRRLAIDKGVKDDQYRTPNIELIFGNDAIVTHRENHLIYKFDITKCMFSFGNIKEKMRMAELDCSKQVVVDLFAGIGYFTLPLLVHAKAKHLYACEWNPDAISALNTNLQLNKVAAGRCTVIEGDNKINRPVGVAQRVILGILPSCANWMHTALECVNKKTGAILHCHDLVEISASPPTTSSASVSLSPASKSQQETASGDNDSKDACNVGEGTIEVSGVDAQEVVSATGGNKEKGSVSKDDSNNDIGSKDDINAESESKTFNSNSSTPSNLEKITMSAVNEINPSDKQSDKHSDSDSPVALEQHGSSNDSAELLPKLNDTISTCSSDKTFEESFSEPTEQENSIYEKKALSLINSIKDELDANKMTATILQCTVVKSYAPRINHVVFDIEIRPSKQE